MVETLPEHTERNSELTDALRAERDGRGKLVRDIESTFREELAKLPDDFPPIKFNFYYGSHSTAEDVGDIDSLLDEADGFIPETFAWTEDGSKRRQDISNNPRSVRADQLNAGDFALAQMSPDPFSHELWSRVRGRRLPILEVDVPGSDPIAKISIEEESARTELTESFDKELGDYQKELEVIIQRQTDREKYMARHLIPTILETYGSDPKQDEIRLVWQLGSAHTALFMGLQKASRDSAHRVFAEELPIVQNHYTEVVRDGMFGVPITRERLAKAWVTSVLDKYMYPIMAHKPSREVNIRMRQIVDSMTMDDIEKIFEEERTGFLSVSTLTAIMPELKESENDEE